MTVNVTCSVIRATEGQKMLVEKKPFVGGVLEVKADIPVERKQHMCRG